MTMVGSLLIALLARVVDFVLGVLEKSMSRMGTRGRRTRRIWAFGAVAGCIVLGAVGIAGTGGRIPFTLRPNP